MTVESIALKGGFLIKGPAGSTKIMGSRAEGMQSVIDGLRQTGVDLVGLADGKPIPVPYGDDIGLFAIVPRLALWLDLKLFDALYLFLISHVGLGFVIGVGFAALIFRDWRTRLFAFAVIALLSAAAFIIAGDVYAISTPVTLALGFGAIYLRRKPVVDNMIPTAMAFLAFGAFAGVAHLVRSQSATPVLLLALLIVLLHRDPYWKKRLLIFAVAVVGFAAVLAAGSGLVDKRDRYLQSVSSEYKPTLPRHLFWHNVFLGFGFLSNPYGFENSDGVAIAKARERAPGTFPDSAAVQSKVFEYERILRGVVFDTVRGHPFFVVKTLFAKAGTMLMYFLIFANLGVIFLVLRRRPWNIDLPFLVSIIFASAPGMLVMPNTNYILSFLTISGIYSVVAFGMGLQGSGAGATSSSGPDAA